MPTPRIDYSKCTSCETCITVCPVGVYDKKGEKVVPKNAKDCTGCRACEVSCPSQAITVEE